MDNTITQIEADVIIIITHTDNNTGETHPFWECDIPMNELHNIARKLTLSFVEFIGHGYARYEIIDFRNVE